MASCLSHRAGYWCTRSINASPIVVINLKTWKLCELYIQMVYGTKMFSPQSCFPTYIQRVFICTWDFHCKFTSSVSACMQFEIVANITAKCVTLCVSWALVIRSFVYDMKRSSVKQSIKQQVFSNFQMSCTLRWADHPLHETVSDSRSSPHWSMCSMRAHSKWSVELGQVFRWGVPSDELTPHMKLSVTAD